MGWDFGKICSVNHHGKEGTVDSMGIRQWGCIHVGTYLKVMVDFVLLSLCEKDGKSISDNLEFDSDGAKERCCLLSCEPDMAWLGDKDGLFDESPFTKALVELNCDETKLSSIAGKWKKMTVKDAPGEFLEAWKKLLDELMPKLMHENRYDGGTEGLLACGPKDLRFTQSRELMCKISTINCATKALPGRGKLKLFWEKWFKKNDSEPLTKKDWGKTVKDICFSDDTEAKFYFQECFEDTERKGHTIELQDMGLAWAQKFGKVDKVTWDEFLKGSNQICGGPPPTPEPAPEPTLKPTPEPTPEPTIEEKPAAAAMGPAPPLEDPTPAAAPEPIAVCERHKKTEGVKTALPYTSYKDVPTKGSCTPKEEKDYEDQIGAYKKEVEDYTGELTKIYLPHVKGEVNGEEEAEREKIDATKTKMKEVLIKKFLVEKQFCACKGEAR